MKQEISGVSEFPEKGVSVHEDSSDLSKRKNDRRRGRTNHQRELVRQKEAKRKQAPQSEANVCRRQKCNLEKNLLY